MYFLADIFTKVLRFAPSEVSHKLALFGLKVTYTLGLLTDLKIKKQEVKIANLTFPNKVGLAAGMDKNGDYIDPLAALGFGFLEIGTVTPKPQIGNKKPRLFRLKDEKSLINRMGFNNKGVDYVVSKIKNRKSKSIIIGISIGKNMDTPIEDAVKDYLECLKKAYQFSDYIALNISSPNTSNLRDLEAPELFVEMINQIKRARKTLEKKYGYKPIFIKLSPDTGRKNRREHSRAILDLEIDGVICSNTSIKHSLDRKGGLSGKLLFAKATESLVDYREFLGDSFPIMASGGVMDVDTYNKKIEAGANLVQVYTGMIYQGPSLISKLLSVSNKD